MPQDSHNFILRIQCFLINIVEEAQRRLEQTMKEGSHVERALGVQLQHLVLIGCNCLINFCKLEYELLILFC